MLISAGYDAHRDDPLASCRVTEEGYAAMTRSVRRACAELEAPVGCVLEGGYDLQALARSVAATMAELRAPETDLGGVSEDVGVAPVAREALARLREWWPELGP
jgi:acetoin utilization deacetylase AcuC-like enzyme